MPSLSHRLAANFSVGALGRLLGSLSPLLLLPLFARRWGSDMYGEWLLITTIPAYIMLAPDFGLAGVAVNHVALLAGKGKWAIARALYQTAFLVQFAVAVGFGLLGWGLAATLNWERIFSLSHLSNSQATVIVGLLCVNIIFRQLAYCTGAVYRAERRNARTGLIGSMMGLAELLSGIILLTVGIKPIGYAMLTAGFGLINLGVFLYDTRRLSPQMNPGTALVNLKLVLPLLKPAFGLGAMPLLNALQNQGILVVIGLVAGPVMVAAFQTTRVLANGIKSVYGIFTASLLIELPTVLGEGKTAIVARLLQRAGQVGILLTLAALAGSMLFGRGIYNGWLGSHVEYHAPLAVLLFASLIPFAAGAPFNLYLYASNHLHRVAVLNLVAGVVTVALGWLLVSKFSLIGAGIAVLIWEAAMAAIAYHCVRTDAPATAGQILQGSTSIRFALEDLRMVVARIRFGGTHD